MKSYRDVGVVLRNHQLGEADRIVTLLTRENGLVRAVAKGVRRTRSKFGARLEPFSCVDVQLYQGRSLDVITQAVTLDANSEDITADYGKYTTGCAILETATLLAGPQGAPAQDLHTLTRGALAALRKGEKPRDLILAAFFLRAMGHAGWMPALLDCARCGAEGPHRAFHPRAGGAVCPLCRPPGSSTPGLGVLDLMAALAEGRWDDAVTASSSARAQAGGLTAAHLQCHMEHQLRTLSLVEGLAEAS
ncbi:MAG: DNA repair protein RecO [Segniliparus sp.]|uniref:DNA repair protein RecO n=1 Tax=Segniliparus sp. TaxID=2804064 RepID=UPI003F2E982C